MNAWMSPMRQRARGHPQAADDGDDHEVEVAEEHHRRLDGAGDELGRRSWPRRAPRSSRRTGPRRRRWRPKTFTSEWPVKASSTWAFSVPVWRHWAMNRVLDRLVMSRTVHEGDRDRDEGDQRQQRRDREHHDEHADDGEHRGEHLAERLLEALGDVVDVVGDPAEQVAAGLAVDVGERQAVELVLDVGAQPVHRCAGRRRPGGRPAGRRAPRRRRRARGPRAARGGARGSRCRRRR